MRKQVKMLKLVPRTFENMSIYRQLNKKKIRLKILGEIRALLMTNRAIKGNLPDLPLAIVMRISTKRLEFNMSIHEVQDYI